MTGWAVRRFWSASEIFREGELWAVRLDNRPVLTPGKRVLAVPTEAMARAVASEWSAQEDKIDPVSMPVTRAANTAIDKVALHRADVAASLAAYGETDLLCYRAESPDELTLRQSQAWDPLIDWAEAAFGARLHSAGGVMPHPQDPEALARLGAEVGAMDPFVLTGLHDLVTLSGSLVLGLAVERGRLPAETAWDLSRIDEEYQTELWGSDGEAEASASIRRDAFIAAERFVSLSREPALPP